MCTSEHADWSPDACRASQVTSPSFRLCIVKNFHLQKVFPLFPPKKKYERVEIEIPMPCPCCIKNLASFVCPGPPESGTEMAVCEGRFIRYPCSCSVSLLGLEASMHQSRGAEDSLVSHPRKDKEEIATFKPRSEGIPPNLWLERWPSGGFQAPASSILSP